MNPTEPPASDPGRSPLIFDWRHRPQTWLKLTGFLLIALFGHLAAFLLFRLRTPPLARAMPLPASITLAPAWPVDPTEAAGPRAMSRRPSPAETADLELPENAVPPPRQPGFSAHVMARQPWPPRPEHAAWPVISGVSEMVLPAATPAPPTEEPADEPR
jgi:hypothetical protein